jgi:hypothetical protein
MPLLCLAVAPPLLMMDGWTRPGIGIALVALGAWLMWGRWRSGWKLEAPEEHAAKLEET